MNCPHCGRFNAGLVHPKIGMVGICLYCGELGLVDRELKLTKTGVGELRKFRVESEIDDIESTRQLIRARIASRKAAC